jgi:hypothetical protein
MKLFKKCPGKPYDPLTSDGCSFFPDGERKGCCIEHDMAYYYGGSAEDKLKADLELSECVEQVSGPFVAMLMYAGVRIFGHPAWPHRFRWGKGLHYCDSFSYNKQVQIRG